MWCWRRQGCRGGKRPVLLKRNLAEGKENTATELHLFVTWYFVFGLVSGTPMGSELQVCVTEIVGLCSVLVNLDGSLRV